MHIYHPSNQRGAGHLIVLVACLLIVAAFAATWTGWKVSHNQSNTNTVGKDIVARPGASPAQVASKGEAHWQYGDQGWAVADGAKAPDCPNPILKTSPVDTAKATAVLLPGQYRGGHSKAHGGFRYDTSASSGDIQVKLPFDGRLVGLTRYIESNEIQYLLTFEQSCGIQVRFDHLFTLSDAFMKIAQTTPEPKVDDTRSLPLTDQPSFKAGTVVATAIGHPATNNIGLDFGVYDLRKPNKVSQNTTWATLHRNEASQTFYGVCWLSWLPRSDANRSEQLMRALPKSEKGASDYCTDAPGGSTLQYNSGQPTN